MSSFLDSGGDLAASSRLSALGYLAWLGGGAVWLMSIRPVRCMSVAVSCGVAGA
ncbi:MAG: hypothetical protein NW223_15445 [Hyphomicrobiaceae bacterium]|nr:hypothetical protein [Hyphomicrobiaceae bacterium]